MPPVPEARDSKPALLCVDDEPRLLESLTLTLERRFRVRTATSGPLALQVLQEDPDIAVIISDMRMPDMDGAELLQRAEPLAPTAVRMLLTGQADVETAIRAINQGRIFRFLTKPCPPAAMAEALDAALRQHELLVAEKVLLQDTLLGSIRALCEVLGMADPLSFGRAQRMQRHAAQLAAGRDDAWQVEMAAALSQLGHVSLPEAVVRKLHVGQALAPAEETMLAGVPAVTEGLLRHIPRLEPVRAILREATAPGPCTSAGAAILRIVSDFETLTAGGEPAEVAVGVMRSRAGAYDAGFLAAFARLQGESAEPREIREVALASLRTGMILADDLRLKTGAVLVARGYCVTEGLLARLRNMDRGSLGNLPRVMVPT